MSAAQGSNPAVYNYGDAQEQATLYILAMQIAACR